MAEGAAGGPPVPLLETKERLEALREELAALKQKDTGLTTEDAARLHDIAQELAALCDQQLAAAAQAAEAAQERGDEAQENDARDEDVEVGATRASRRGKTIGVLSHLVLLVLLMLFVVLSGRLLALVREANRESLVIFFGNPGAGKSTLLSSVSGLKFESGPSWVKGLTSTLQFQTSPTMPNIRFADTPGLADANIAESASQAIFEALQEAARQKLVVKLFFVATLEEGRLRAGDIFTIKQVMESIKLTDGTKPPRDSYGLIINKCDLLGKEEFHAVGEPKLRAFMDGGMDNSTLPIPTTHLKVLPLHDDLVKAWNKTREFDGLSEFVLNFRGLRNIADATKIDVRSYEERHIALLEEYTKKIRELDSEPQPLKPGDVFNDIWDSTMPLLRSCVQSALLSVMGPQITILWSLVDSEMTVVSIALMVVVCLLFLLLCPSCGCCFGRWPMPCCCCCRCVENLLQLAGCAAIVLCGAVAAVSCLGP